MLLDRGDPGVVEDEGARCDSIEWRRPIRVQFCVLSFPDVCGAEGAQVSVCSHSTILQSWWGNSDGICSSASRSYSINMLMIISNSNAIKFCYGFVDLNKYLEHICKLMLFFIYLAALVIVLKDISSAFCSTLILNTYNWIMLNGFTFKEAVVTLKNTNVNASLVLNMKLKY